MPSAQVVESLDYVVDSKELMSFSRLHQFIKFKQGIGPKHLEYKNQENFKNSIAR